MRQKGGIVSDVLVLKATRCPHGVWHYHNALRDDETGEVFDDPDGPCPGGTVEVNGKVWHVSMALARFLKDAEPGAPD